MAACLLQEAPPATATRRHTGLLDVQRALGGAGSALGRVGLTALFGAYVEPHP
jgi:hypothetical protein